MDVKANWRVQAHIKHSFAAAVCEASYISLFKVAFFFCGWLPSFVISLLLLPQLVLCSFLTVHSASVITLTIRVYLYTSSVAINTISKAVLTIDATVRTVVVEEYTYGVPALAFLEQNTLFAQRGTLLV